ncbi:zeta toxin family protein [Chitinophaga sp. CF418]|uniref:zeta toxin family protein n=1 Tax=Chitinophaga sp. CF418 TaxID=1855287 RepID=UPI000923F9E8|nr:zeta toxin family protein [Chitinophaga sp. CF418]SHN45508.1 Predicted ABC-type ATPase [Chitinophaga sp. CF418]
MPFSIKPKLFIVTGSNGAGKSTYRQYLLPPEFSYLDVFDGDLFYTRKSIEFYKIHGSSKEARKQAEEALEQEFLRMVDHSVTQRIHFAYEGHFTGAGAWKIPQRFKAEGFEIHLIFCGLNTVTKSIKRVDERVKEGGFHVTPLAIQNNFYGNMEMLEKNYQMFNSVEILDTSSDQILQVAKLEHGRPMFSLPADEIPEWFKNGMPKLYDIVLAIDS